MRRSVCPWFRASKDAWFVCHEGKQKNLRVKGEGNRGKRSGHGIGSWEGFPFEPTSPIESHPKPVEVKPEPSVKVSEGIPSEVVKKSVLAS